MGTGPAVDPRLRGGAAALSYQWYVIDQTGHSNNISGATASTCVWPATVLPNPAKPKAPFTNFTFGVKVWNADFRTNAILYSLYVIPDDGKAAVSAALGNAPPTSVPLRANLRSDPFRLPGIKDPGKSGCRRFHGFRRSRIAGPSCRWSLP